jgi:c-di-GMP-binding flagellar brake protein YcgR
MNAQNSGAAGAAGAVRELRWEDVLPLLIRERTPLIIEFQVIEDGAPVMARGACFIASVAENAVALGGFTPRTVVRLLKPGMDLSVRLTRDGCGYQARIKVLTAGIEDATASMPERLRFETRRFLRIMPSTANPVQVYVLMPSLPTARLTAVEVGQRGLSFLSPEGLDMGSSSAFTIVLPGPSSIILCSGTIRYKRAHENGFLYGVELHIHPRDEESLARYIMQREREIRELL